MTQRLPVRSRPALLAIAAAMVAAGAAAGVPPTRAVTPAEFAAEVAGLRGKVVMLNVWATWCVPCLREIPDLLAVGDELGPRGLVLLGLAVDEPSDTAQVEAFRQKYFADFRTLHRTATDMDAAVSVVDPAWNEIVPTTYIIGRDGKIVTRMQGKKTPAEFRAAALEAVAPP